MKKLFMASVVLFIVGCSSIGEVTFNKQQTQNTEFNKLGLHWERNLK